MHLNNNNDSFIFKTLLRKANSLNIMVMCLFISKIDKLLIGRALD